MDDQHALISQLATLARLKLSAEETAAFEEQIPRLLAYVDQLKSVETGTVPEVDQQQAVLRPDVAEPSGIEADIRAQGPTMADQFWKVPPVK